MDRLTYFQASQLKDQEVIDQFVVRKVELDIILSTIRSDDMSGSIQHYILIGQRGSGKSTLLRRLQAEVATDAALGERIVAVNLSEEQAGIYRLHDLWDRVAEELREQDTAVQPVDWELHGNDLVALARAAHKSVQQALRASGRKLLLLLDNIDRIFENLGDQEAHLLRELLMNHKDLRIVGGSTRLSEHHWKYDRPFYEFFRVIRLEPLDPQELRDLLLSWSLRLKEPGIRGFVENHGGRLEALRILSDGMPRTMLHLLELLIQKPEDNGFDYLHRIVDRATPIYQERLGVLSPHQRKVLLELSFFWESASAKQLRETARMDTRTLSAVLNKLSELRLIEAIPGKGKNNFYRVQERFFNLWLIMTQGGPRQKRRVKYLTLFLEIWYGKEGFAEYVTGYRGRLKEGGVDAGHAALLTQALARSSHISATDRDALIEDTRPLMLNRKEFAEHLPATSTEACDKAMDLLLQKKYHEAQAELSDLEQETALKDMLLGWAAGGLGDLSRCMTLVGQGVALDDSAPSLNKAGFVLLRLNQYTSAETYFLRAIDKGDANAHYNLAYLYQETGKEEQAEQFYLRAINKGNVNALNNLATLYAETGKHEQAEQFYLRSIDKGQVDALYNLAILYRETGKPEQAEQFYLRAIDKGTVNALYNLANLYAETGKHEQAEQSYLRAIDKGDVEALNNLANLYAETGKPEQAEQFYLRAIDKGLVKALYNLALFDYLRYQPPGRALDRLARLKAAPQKFGITERCLEAVLLTWAGRPEETQPIASLLRDLLAPDSNDSVAFWARQFLVHHRTHDVWASFNSEDLGAGLKDQLQPLYFATAKLVGKAGEDAVRVMPTELASTVEDILKVIEQDRARYYPPGK